MCHSQQCTWGEPTIGKDCSRYSPDSRYCSVGEYCDHELKTCQKIKSLGEACVGQDECGFGAFCDRPSDEPVCRKIGTKQPGEPLMYSQQVVAPDDQWCESGQRTQGLVDFKYRCVKATHSQESPYGKKQQIGEMCPYVEYSDIHDWDKGVTKSAEAKCGFNQDESAYCPAYKGDETFTSMWHTYLASIDKDDARSTCHVRSEVRYARGAQCKTLQHALPKDFDAHVRQALWEVGSNQGYPSIADNAPCVRASITKAFWRASPEFVSE